MRNSLVLFLLVLSEIAFAQHDTIGVAADSLQAQFTPFAENIISNGAALKSFYQKLADLQNNKNRIVNIVHVGDSHIQADMMTAVVRQKLQQEFGNAGRGFVFPYTLAKTVGSRDVRFSSTGSWQSLRNIYSPDGSKVGLSGIALQARNNESVIEVDAKDSVNYFSRLKIITPANVNAFAISTGKRVVRVETLVPKKLVHRIRKGETLSAIADKYNIGISTLKSANGLKSSNIRAGKTLKIPTGKTEPQFKERIEYVPMQLQADVLYHYYDFNSLTRSVDLLPNGDGEHILSGIVLENGQPGIQYHSIGVNGAKFSDYNKYPLFFEQLKALSPDLVVVSLGTNDSFDKLSADDYMLQLIIFIQMVKQNIPNASVLIATAPPSLFQRKNPNTLIAEYAARISSIATQQDYAVWDMLSILGGNSGIEAAAKNGLIGGDRVHYSKAGYQMQGDLLSKALLQGLTDYQKQQ